MVSNFDFLKNSDRNLYEIISEAEYLYRDEYYEQCMGQTRRFAENVCRKVLGNKRTTEDTFDQMLATLKDNSQGSDSEKEFLDDLYFLKKCGNKSVHSSSVKKDGINALECLKRAFEVAINYSVYGLKDDSKNLNRHYDIQLLVTGKRDKTLEKKYEKAKRTAKSDNSKSKPSQSKKRTTGRKTSKTKELKQQTSMKSCSSETGISAYWIVVGVFSIITFGLMLFLLTVK